MGPQRRKGCMVPNGSVPMYVTDRFPSLHYEVPHNMGSVLVKKIRIVALNIFEHEVQVGMQSTGMICTALVFAVQVFLCQLLDAYSEVEYITLKNVPKNCCYFKVSVWFVLTELQHKDEKMFILMSSSQKCHAVNVLHAWPYMCKLLCSLLLLGLLVHDFDPICLHLAFPRASHFPPFFICCIFRTGSAPSRNMLLFPPVEIEMEGTFPFLWFQLNKKKAGLLSGFVLLTESGATSALYKWTIHKS